MELALPKVSRLVFALTAALAANAASPVVAQREIVQSLPPKAADDLNRALRRLASNAGDVGALIDAGNASLELNDAEAAIGFFVRAREVSSTNAPAIAGLARANVQLRRPVEALRLFSEAERAGYDSPEIAADRALAYDLVGDNARAQEFYSVALARRDTPELRRRFALSHAIAGNKDRFEALLLPMLEAEDRAGFRTRAFGLAILGRSDEAVSIAEALMPTDLALRMAPYLRYMKRLTKAQQAAAANLGAFPRASDIGKDDPRIASYASEGRRIAQTASQSLTPQGAPLGTQAQPPQERPRQASRRERRVGRQSLDDRSRRTASRATEEPRAATPARIEPSSTPPLGQPVQTVQQTPTPTPTPPAEPVQVAARAPGELPPTERVQVSAQPTQAPARIETVPVQRSAAAQIGPQDDTPPARTVVVARQSEPEPAAVPLAPPATPAPTVTATPTPSESPSEVSQASVADAFGDLAAVPAASRRASSGAVDITAIKPPREVEEKKPEPPVHPARYWVQVATGRDRDALAFDWRRIARKADGLLENKGPFVTPWGAANRLLSGPYKDAAQANKMMNDLKALDIDSFMFQSADGEAIESLR